MRYAKLHASERFIYSKVTAFWADKYAKYRGRKERALATIVLLVDPSLLYLLGEPEDPVAVWEKLAC